jgi:aminoglycoside 2''-adenylyltransferase
VSTSLAVGLIHDLFDRAADLGMPLWLESGWAIDARLHRVSREHDDIDIAFPADRRLDFEALLREFDAGPQEEMDYGFLASVRGVLLDCEPCELHGKRYELEGMPAGSCPFGKEGSIDGRPIRCVSWMALLWEYLYYAEEMPQAAWRPKDFEGFQHVRIRLGDATVQSQMTRFARNRRHARS